MKQYLQIIEDGDTLSEDQAEQALNLIMTGNADESEVAALLSGMAKRGESESEIIGMLRGMRSQMVKIDLGNDLLDTCGTGGDGLSTFNISTTVALICAALGVKVAKHGNRAASSKSGSADVLEALGVPIELSGGDAKEYFNEHNFVFLFARTYHPAMKHVASVRKELGIRTIFNFLGPLANPAGVTRQIVGVSNPEKAKSIGNALMALGAEHVLVIFSEDGMDEASIATPTSVLDFKLGHMEEFTVQPRQIFSLADIAGGEPEENAQLIKNLAIGNVHAAVKEAVILNAGLALYTADDVSSYQQGIEKVEEFLNSGEFDNYLQKL
ncbi:MAG: anthranilate phosphoribosyltransferase [bacterium]|nr:anthranilate phosphoribosyltransferase [bacterium]